MGCGDLDDRRGHSVVVVGIGHESQGSDMSLHVVIVNYRTPKDLDLCLKSLAENRPTIDYMVTVVDNDRTDETSTVVSRHATQDGHPMFVYVTNENIGYARACNQAGLGGHDVAGFFNADVEFTPGILDTCHNALMDNPDWGVLGPRQVDRTGRITHAGIFGSSSKPILRGWRKRGDDYKDVDEYAISVSGSAYFVKANVWEELNDCWMYEKGLAELGLPHEGAFLPTPHYYEETWLSYHCRAHGWKVVYWGADTMIHQWHQASRVGGDADKMMPRSRELFRRMCDIHGLAHD